MAAPLPPGKENRKLFASICAPRCAPPEKERLISGAINNDIEEKKADYIFEQVAEFAGYGFNKSHAAAYALIAYQTAYLKTHYSEYFMTASMSLEKDNTDKLSVFFNDAKKSFFRKIHVNHCLLIKFLNVSGRWQYSNPKNHPVCSFGGRAMKISGPKNVFFANLGVPSHGPHSIF